MPFTLHGRRLVEQIMWLDTDTVPTATLRIIEGGVSNSNEINRIKVRRRG